MFQIRLDQDGTVPMDGLVGGLTIGANRFFREGARAQFVDDRAGRDYDGDLAGWSALIGRVAGSEGSPGLGDNRHLLPGSPCIDAGLAVGGLMDDYDGNPRRGSPDIGADEANAGAELQVPPPAGTIGTHGREIVHPTTPVTPSAPLTVAGIVLPAAGAYSAGRRLRFTVTLSGSAEVIGEPQLHVLVGASTRTAAFASGSGSSQLVFEYVVRRQDDAKSVAIGQKVLFPGNSAIVAGGSHLASALPRGIAGMVAGGVRLDTRAPTVVGRVGMPTDGVYSAGRSLDFLVRFSEGVFVAGTPRLTVTGLNVTRQASYVSGSGTPTLTFRYVIRPGDAVRSTKGLGLGRFIVTPSGTTLSDDAGNRAALVITSPSVNGIRLASTRAKV